MNYHGNIVTALMGDVLCEDNAVYERYEWSVMSSLLASTRFIFIDKGYWTGWDFSDSDFLIRNLVLE
jgi:hypothetical protein